MEPFKYVLVGPSQDERLLVAGLVNVQEFEGLLLGHRNCFRILLLRLCDESDVFVHVLLLVSLKSFLE